MMARRPLLARRTTRTSSCSDVDRPSSVSFESVNVGPLTTKFYGSTEPDERLKGLRKATDLLKCSVPADAGFLRESDEARRAEHEAIDGERRQGPGVEPAHQETDREVGGDARDDDANDHLTVDVRTG